MNIYELNSNTLNEFPQFLVKKINLKTGEIFHKPELTIDQYGQLVNERIFCFEEYSNPLGEWRFLKNNPLAQLGLQINCIDESENLIFVESNDINLY